MFREETDPILRQGGDEGVHIAQGLGDGALFGEGGKWDVEILQLCSRNQRLTGAEDH